MIGSKIKGHFLSRQGLKDPDVSTGRQENEGQS